MVLNNGINTFGVNIKGNLILTKNNPSVKTGGLFLYNFVLYSTVTDFARFLGLSTSKPFSFAM